MKTKIRKSKPALIAVAALGVLYSLFAFIPADLNNAELFTQRVSYDLEVETRYVLPSGTNVESLSSLDASRLRSKVKRMHIERELGLSGIPVTTITQLSDTQLESWSTLPSKIVYDESEMRIYKADGSLQTQRPYSPDEVSMRELINVNPNYFGKQPLLQAFSSAQISQLEASGASVTALSSNEVKISTPNTELIQNHNQLSLDRRQFENGQLKSRNQTRFLPTNDGAYMIPAIEIQRSFETLTSGLCIEKIEVKRYQNYRINDASPLAIGLQEGAEVDVYNNIETTQIFESPVEVKVFPNPATNELNLLLNGATFKKGMKVEIRNAAGQMLIQKKINLEMERLQLNVVNIPQGIYLIEVIDGNQSWNKRFVKQ